MRRLFKYLAWSIAILIALPILLTGAVLLGANTDPGRRLIEALVSRVTDGAVRLEGLRGRFPKRCGSVG